MTIKEKLYLRWALRNYRDKQRRLVDKCYLMLDIHNNGNSDLNDDRVESLIREIQLRNDLIATYTGLDQQLESENGGELVVMVIQANDHHKKIMIDIEDSVMIPTRS